MVPWIGAWPDAIHGMWHYHCLQGRAVDDIAASRRSSLIAIFAAVVGVVLRSRYFACYFEESLLLRRALLLRLRRALTSSTTSPRSDFDFDVFSLLRRALAALLGPGCFNFELLFR